METKTIDYAVCPNCKKKFNPDNFKLSEWGHSYEIECPCCKYLLEVFESIEYQVTIVK